MDSRVDPRLASTPADERIGAGRLIAFSTLALPVAAAQLPLNVYLPAIYSQHYGVPLALLGSIFLIEKLWGAAADPLIGALSDRGGTRWGRRRPWILAGGALFGIAGLALFFPPAKLSTAWLAGALFLFYLGWSMIQIPYSAWSGEISRDYHERTRIVTYQAVLSSVALLLVLLMPTAIDQLWPDDAPLKLGAMGAVILAALLASLPLTLRAMPEPPSPVTAPVRPSIAATIAIVVRDGPLMRVLASDFAVTLGQSIRAGLFVFFVSAYMGLPQWASGLYLLQFIFSIAAGPIWLAVAKRIGKHRAMISGEVVQVAINLGLLATMPGELPLLLALTAAQGLAQGSGNLMLRSMVADAADRHRLETGHDRTALFFSVFSLSMKAAMAVAIGIALPLVAWAGFDPAAAHNSADSLRFLLCLFALGPAVAHAVSAILIWRFPIDAATHAAIQRALDERDTPLNFPTGDYHEPIAEQRFR